MNGDQYEIQSPTYPPKYSLQHQQGLEARRSNAGSLSKGLPLTSIDVYQRSSKAGRLQYLSPQLVDQRIDYAVAIFARLLFKRI